MKFVFVVYCLFEVATSTSVDKCVNGDVEMTDSNFDSALEHFRTCRALLSEAPSLYFQKLAENLKNTHSAFLSYTSLDPGKLKSVFYPILISLISLFISVWIAVYIYKIYKQRAKYVSLERLDGTLKKPGRGSKLFRKRNKTACFKDDDPLVQSEGTDVENKG